MTEAMSVIRRDLGPDAVIVSTRRVREPGIRGLFRAPWLEVTAAADDYPSARGQDWELRRRVEEIRGMLDKVTGHLGIGRDEVEERLVRWRDLLRRLEVNAELIDQILGGMEGLVRVDGEGQEVIWEAIVGRVTSVLSEAWPTRPPARVTALVGPTGVGKTTTLAKLAARYSLMERKKVGLVTIDTYRIGAVQQLKIYGEILGVPVEEVYTPQELQQKIEGFADKDVVLIDTVGRSPHNDLRLAELRSYLERAGDMDRYLVLSCTTKTRDLEDVVASFGQLKPTGLIFTKLDETRCRGGILNVVVKTGLPVMYVTTGQNVPDDIERAGPEKLARLILGVGEYGRPGASATATG
jgi:flagellar biosynthesis protein FlhF